MNTVTEEKATKSLRDANLVFIDNEQDVLDELKEDFAYYEVEITNMFFITDYEQLDEIIKNNTIDIIISDFRMPRKNGIEVMELVRQKYPSIVLVLRTGYTISFKSEEKERCDASNIKILFKHDGFNLMCAKLGDYLNEDTEVDAEFKNKVDKSERKTLSHFALKKISKYMNPVNYFEALESNKKNNLSDDDWIHIRKVPAKVLKVFSEKVQCECVINTSLKKTQIREYPRILFENINDLKENSYVQIKIKLKPGFSCTEIAEENKLKFEQIFEPENLDDLDNFNTVKLT